MRALPVSQVKSANANGSVAGAFAAPDLPFAVACGVPEAPAVSAGMTFAFATAAVGAGVTPAALVTAAEAAGLSEPGCENGAAAVAGAGELYLSHRPANHLERCWPIAIPQEATGKFFHHD